jgi:hypothetical protein
VFLAGQRIGEERKCREALKLRQRVDVSELGEVVSSQHQCLEVGNFSR